MLKRFYDLEKLIKPGKVLVIYGPRQVGKTTLLEKYLSATKYKYRIESGESIRIRQLLGSQDFELLDQYAEGYELIAVDEAQNIQGVGKGLKILVDRNKKLRIIVTGSSSFEISKNIGEPLTGRKRTVVLYPIAQIELLKQFSRFDISEKLEEYLVYGSYPEVLTAKSKSAKVEILNELVDSYLFKDILAFERVRNSKKLFDLLKLLAFQIGSEVSLNELATQLKIDVKTVDRYLDLLEKTFVIKKLSSFGKNLRNEVTTKSKYYFLDTGIRNAIISQFAKINLRDDTGKLFENFIIMERIKSNHYRKRIGQMYFWRNYQNKEIDLIEERNGKLFAYEIKWSEKRKVKKPKEFIENYKNSTFKVINRKNYLDFVK